MNYPVPPTPTELMSLAAYVSEDGLVGNQWKERPIGHLQTLNVLSTGESQGQEIRVEWVGEWVGGAGGGLLG